MLNLLQATWVSNGDVNEDSRPPIEMYKLVQMKFHGEMRCVHVNEVIYNVNNSMASSNSNKLELEYT